MMRDNATAAGELAHSAIYTYRTKACPAVALRVCAMAASQLTQEPHKTVVEAIYMRCVANLMFASKNGKSTFDEGGPAQLVEDVRACHLDELTTDHTAEILAMLTDGRDLQAVYEQTVYRCHFHRFLPEL